MPVSSPKADTKMKNLATRVQQMLGEQNQHHHLAAQGGSMQVCLTCHHTQAAECLSVQEKERKGKGKETKRKEKRKEGSSVITIQPPKAKVSFTR